MCGWGEQDEGLVIYGGHCLGFRGVEGGGIFVFGLWMGFSDEAIGLELALSIEEGCW
jgi:hypothetical protein